MEGDALPRRSDAAERQDCAESLLAARFETAGWDVRRPSDGVPFGPDLLVRRRGAAYAVAVLAGIDARSGRLVALVAQALLQAARAASQGAAPLAVVVAPRVSQRAGEQVIKFAEDFAPDAGVGIVDFQGLGMFRGPHLEELNAKAKAIAPGPARSTVRAGQLFSDLNQWMLKVLLAPELPDNLLSAPRGKYRNASQLARAANVSVMSAFRFVRQLQQEGYLHESAEHLSLVRREDLFSRWQAMSARSARELPLRFILPGNVQSQLRKMVGGGRACLALFAAADALRLGFVQGVPLYAYVHRIQPENLAASKSVRACRSGEPADVIVRQAPAPQSIFRGMVRPGGLAVSDVLQIWVDVSAHPSRGGEQADLIRKRVLRRLIEGCR